MFEGKISSAGVFADYWRIARRLGLAGAVVLCLSGCGSIDPTNPIPTQNSDVVPTPPRGDDGNVVVPGSDTSSKPAVTMAVAPVYCCNPRSMVFEAKILDIPNPDQVVFRWAFGDGRTGQGTKLEHTYGWPGEYVVRLEAELPDGTIILAEHELLLPGETAVPDEDPPAQEPGVEGPQVPDEPDTWEPEPPPVEDPDLPDDPIDPLAVNQEMIDQVLAGIITTANAAWWGFDESDATHAIQGAINSGAKTVIIPNVGKDWIVRPLFLVSNQEVIFENGVVVMAKLGEFRGVHDCLLSAENVSNVILRGYGAVLRMRKADYKSSAYSISEFRHVLFMQKVSNIQVLGLSFQSSGGDGIYIGPRDDYARIPPRDILIKDCDCYDNYRQGISVLSAENLTIENCTLRGTIGTAPQAGIDLEPNHVRDVLINVKLIDCTASGNSGSGFMANLTKMNSTSKPISITVQNMLVQGSRQAGIRALVIEDGPPGGFLELRDCICETNEYSGLGLKWNLSTAFELRFVNCTWRKTARLWPEFPFLLKFMGSRISGAPGGIRFENCHIEDQQVRHSIKIDDAEVVSGVADMTGTIFVTNPNIDEPIPTTAWPYPDLDVVLVP